MRVRTMQRNDQYHEPQRPPEGRQTIVQTRLHYCNRTGCRSDPVAERRSGTIAESGDCVNARIRTVQKPFVTRYWISDT